MAEIWDEAQLIADGFERAHVELDWYDGPRVGVADIDGQPHYFKGHHYERYHEDDEYEVWPASSEALEREREQSAIFVKWSERYRAGRQARDPPRPWRQRPLQRVGRPTRTAPAST